jgi:hypothetical protein
MGLCACSGIWLPLRLSLSLARRFMHLFADT